MIRINQHYLIASIFVFSVVYLCGTAAVNAGGDLLIMDWIGKGINQDKGEEPRLIAQGSGDQPTKQHLREEELKKLDEQLKELERRRFELKTEGEEDEEGEEGIGETGTDPRDFAPKFMPYYRYTELENELEQNEFVLFGLFPFSKKLAMTYEIPLAYERDIRSTDAYKNGLSELPSGGFPIPNDLPIGEGDGKETGIGDMNLRFMYRHDWDFLGFDWLSGVELVFPTATEDELGSETFIVKPMLTLVRDIGFWPAPGAFFALMNFYGFDAWKDSGRDSVNQYIGRYFFMLPVHPSGIYMLPEVQAIHDFENHHSSFWIGPEVGKLLAPGRILYLKPGFGINPSKSKGDRNWTFEVGFRYFFD